MDHAMAKLCEWQPEYYIFVGKKYGIQTWGLHKGTQPILIPFSFKTNLKTLNPFRIFLTRKSSSLFPPKIFLLKYLNWDQVHTSNKECQKSSLLWSFSFISFCLFVHISIKITPWLGKKIFCSELHRWT